jgi:hypothetical protein
MEAQVFFNLSQTSDIPVQIIEDTSTILNYNLDDISKEYES